MALFGNSHAECLAAIAGLRAELSELRARVTNAERTATDAAETAYRHMKKTQMAARRALEAAESENQDPGHSGDVRPETPLALPPPVLTGARARIAARRAAAAGQRLPFPEANGVHP